MSVSPNTSHESNGSPVTRTTLAETYQVANTEVLTDLSVRTESGWNETVGDVIVVLCASRSGSSLIFNALSSTGKVVAPAGEHEPWMILSGNKFPFTASDELNDGISNPERLLGLMRRDLLVREKQLGVEQVIEPVRDRLIIRRQHDVDGYGAFIARLIARGKVLQAEWPQIITEMSELTDKPMPTRLEDIGDPEYGLPLENPPLIEQPLARVATDDELTRMPLLFKSPSDAYRPGMYEQLFPNARINYIHLTRGFVQTTNGIMDGWQKNDIDFISNPVGMTSPLHIDEYSITAMSTVYWCFDLFPGWEEFVDRPLVEVAAAQWLQAHTRIVEGFHPIGHLTFESFYSNPEQFYSNLSDLTDIDTTGYDWSKSVMSTEPPSQMRWLKRAGVFRNLDIHIPGELFRSITEMQSHLGYTMDEATWH